jgi:hypothetical protein
MFPRQTNNRRGAVMAAPVSERFSVNRAGQRRASPVAVCGRGRARRPPRHQRPPARARSTGARASIRPYSRRGQAIWGMPARVAQGSWRNLSSKIVKRCTRLGCAASEFQKAKALALAATPHQPESADPGQQQRQGRGHRHRAGLKRQNAHSTRREDYVRLVGVLVNLYNTCNVIEHSNGNPEPPTVRIFIIGKKDSIICPAKLIYSGQMWKHNCRHFSQLDQ